jgi:ABC-type multidrug transport system fused ATPase/permease subunit
MEHLRQRGMTVIAIAHRLATVRAADHVVVLAGGRVDESGTYAALAAREGGRLRRLIAAGAALP